jgi:hypothetical protein
MNYQIEGGKKKTIPLKKNQKKKNKDFREELGLSIFVKIKYKPIYS